MEDIPKTAYQKYESSSQPPANPAPADRIRRAQQFATVSRKQQAEIVKLAVEQIKSSRHLEGRKLIPVVKSYQEADENIRGGINDLQDMAFRDVTARDLGVAYPERQALSRQVYQAENDYIASKTGFVPTGANLDKVLMYLKSQGVSVDGLNHTRLRQLIMLDDWSSIAATALPLIIKHGPQFVSHLWKMYLPKLRTLAGMDAGLWEGDTPSRTDQPSRMSLWPGVSKDVATAPTPTSNTSAAKYSSADVNVDYVASVVCPERYAERRYDPAP